MKKGKSMKYKPGKLTDFHGRSSELNGEDKEIGRNGMVCSPYS